MGAALNEFQDKFQVEALKVAESEHWVLSVRPQQLTLGSMVLSAKANVLGFAELDEAQSKEMAYLLGVAEERVKTLWGAVRINVLCLMMQDPLLHFHIFPRYDKSVRFNDKEWVDSDWPKPPQVKPTEENSVMNASLIKALQSD